MRICCILVLGCTTLFLEAQTLLPVKIQNRWGLIDTSGRMAVEPRYDAIGAFKAFGYAVMQRNGKVGLLNASGHEILPPQYEDLKVLDSALMAVSENGRWMVINLEEQIILPPGYDKLQLWPQGYLSFQRDKKWGVVAAGTGRTILPAQFDEVQLYKDRYFITRMGNYFGMANAEGQEILAPTTESIEPFTDSIFLFQRNRQWGLIHASGKMLVPVRVSAFRHISENYLLLQSGSRSYLFSAHCQAIVYETTGETFIPLTRRYLITQKNQKLGLIDWCGQVSLSTRYDEILLYSPETFRVKVAGKWALVKAEDLPLTTFQYDYISPLRSAVSVVKKDNHYGLINRNGAELAPAVYEKMMVEDTQAKGYRLVKKGQESAETLDIIQFDEDGNRVAETQFDRHFRIRVGNVGGAASGYAIDGTEYVLDKYEWFYASESGKWGLRNLLNGMVQIPPTFQRVTVYRDLGFTLVAMPNSKDFEFERTTFRFDNVYGLVKNDLGALVTDMDFWDFRLEDFQKGYPLARCLFSNGRFGLIDRRGKVALETYAYLGDFQDGMARMSKKGIMSGALRPEQHLGNLADFLSEILPGANLADQTQYDKLFLEQAFLTCEDCEWGYIDTMGREQVKPQFAFVRDYSNDVGIVLRESGWGVVNRQGQEIIPCRYDDIHFLENTGNKIIRLYIERPKYGLIDTLGQLTVNAVFDQVGAFRENRLAVQIKDLWGFVDQRGAEVIPARFQQVGDFYEGLAAARSGRYWGFIDQEGHPAVPFQYLQVGHFQEGLAWVMTENGVGYLNAGGQMVIPPAFEEASAFSQGVAWVRQEGKYGLIDQQGRYIVRPRFVDIAPFDQNGLAKVKIDPLKEQSALVNRAGNIITRQVYQDIRPFSEGLAVVRLKDNFGFIDTTGQLVIPARYSRAEAFSEGRAAIYREGACGYIDASGKEVIPLSYSRCQPFEGGRAVVYQGMRKAGLLDGDGRLLIEPSINRLLGFSQGRGLVRDDQYRFYFITEQANMYNGYYQRAGTFSHGVAVVQINGKWGIIDRRGIELIPPKYSLIESFENGYAKVRIDGFNGLSTTKGELIVSPDFEYITYAGQGLFRVEQGDKIGYFDSSGNWIWALSN